MRIGFPFPWKSARCGANPYAATSASVPVTVENVATPSRWKSLDSQVEVVGTVAKAWPGHPGGQLRRPRASRPARARPRPAAAGPCAGKEPARARPRRRRCTGGTSSPRRPSRAPFARNTDAVAARRAGRASRPHGSFRVASGILTARLPKAWLTARHEREKTHRSGPCRATPAPHAHCGAALGRAAELRLPGRARPRSAVAQLERAAHRTALLKSFLV